MSKELTLEDFEVRYGNIRRSKPNVEECSVAGCRNPRDSTKYLGEDTCCAYQRLLFDYWSGDVKNLFTMTQRGTRRAFTNWRNKTGRKACDKIVLEVAREPINWEC